MKTKAINKVTKQYWRNISIKRINDLEKLIEQHFHFLEKHTHYIPTADVHISVLPRGFGIVLETKRDVKELLNQMRVGMNRNKIKR